MDFEKNLKELESLAENMSAGQMGLTESIAAFKKGMEIVRRCRKELGEAEQVVEKLVRIREGGQPETEPFESAEAAASAKPGAESRQANKPKAPALTGKTAAAKDTEKNGGGGRHSNGSEQKPPLSGSKKTSSQKDLF